MKPWFATPLLGAAILLPWTAVASETLVAKSSAKPPEWITKPPPEADGLVYFVGLGEKEESLDRGREAAFRDAARQAAEFVQTRVSGRMLVLHTGIENRLVDELRTSARGALSGARVQGTYWEQFKAGRWTRPRFFRAWALVGVPRSELSRERARLAAIAHEFDRRLDEVCAAAGDWLGVNAPKRAVAVGGFREAVSDRRYGFSRVVEARLSNCLAAGGVVVTHGARPALTLTGTYYRASDEDVALEVGVVRLADGGRLWARTATFPQDSISPEWLRVGDAEDEFFAGLERAEPRGAPRTGRLSLVTRPPGARIFVDGEDRGKTPTDLPEIPIGPHTVVLSKEGYALQGATVTVLAEQTATVDLDLPRKEGELSVETVPPRAEVFVDGRLRGIAPLTITLPVGRHEVILRRRECKDRELTVDIQYRDTSRVGEMLEQDPGGAAFVSDPESAEVYLDGDQKPRGRTPVKVQPLAVGEHSAVVVKPGFGRWSGAFAVRSNRITSVAATLTRFEGAQVLVRATPSDAELWIDGRQRPEFSGVGLYDLSAGRHTVRLTREGLRAWEQEVSLKTGSFLPLDAHLKAAAYTPEGREVDAGSLMDYGPTLTPLSGDSLAACKEGSTFRCWLAVPEFALDLVALPFRLIGAGARAITGSRGAGEEGPKRR